MREGSTQVLLTNILAGYGFDDFRTGNEHLGALFHHVNEVCQGRAVNSTAGTRAHDGRNLRNHTGRKGVLLEHLPKASKGIRSFLNPGPTGIRHANDGCTRF